MDKIISNWRLILFIAMSIAIVVLYKVADDANKKYKEEKMYNDTRAIEDSVRFRQEVRAMEHQMYLYRDSLRQVKINLIITENESNRKETYDAISRLRTSGNEYRDSIWAAEWEKEESAPF